MPYRIIIFSLFYLGVCLPLRTQQPGKRVRVRTEQRANQRLDQKVDAGVDKAFGAIEGLFQKKGASAAPADTATSTPSAEAGPVSLPMSAGRGSWVAFTNPTPFSLVMNVTETKKNGKEQQTTLRMGATADRFAVLVVGEGSERSQMILNTEDGKTTMITTDKKGKSQGFRMRMPNLGKTVAETTDEMADYLTFTKTGERKTIDGYDCEKIIVKDSKHNTTTESWVTQDLNLSYRDVFGGLAGMAGAGKQNFSAPTGPAAPYEGFPILSVTDDGKSLTKMHLTDIQVGDAIDRSLFDTGGVEIQELGF